MRLTKLMQHIIDQEIIMSMLTFCHVKQLYYLFANDSINFNDNIARNIIDATSTTLTTTTATAGTTTRHSRLAEIVGLSICPV